MARYGFSGGKTELKFLILFVLLHYQDRASLSQLTEMVLLDEAMDYFTFSDALQDLLVTQHLTLDNDECYSLTPKGFQNAEIVQSDITPALRRASSDAVLAMQKRMRLEKSIKTEILNKEGEVYVHLVLSDGNAPLLELTLPTATEKQAKLLSSRFRERAETLLASVLQILLDEKA